MPTLGWFLESARSDEEAKENVWIRGARKERKGKGDTLDCCCGGAFGGTICLRARSSAYHG